MEWVPVGKIVSVQGIRGEVKFYYYNEVKEDFLRYTSLFIIGDDAKTEIRPAKVRFHKNFIYIYFKGFKSAEEASILVDQEVYVREEDLLNLEEGEYYEYQLIGLDVITRTGEKLGTVASILHTGANDVLVCTEADVPMIPLVEGFVIEVDVKQGFVRIDEETLAL